MSRRSADSRRYNPWAAGRPMFRSRARLEAEILVLRQQINVLRRNSSKRSVFRPFDRPLFVGRTCGCWTLPWRRNTGRIGKAGGWNRRPMRHTAPGGDGRGGVAGTDWAGVLERDTTCVEERTRSRAAEQTRTAFSELRSQTDPAYKPAVKESLSKLPISIAQPIQQ
jgi:hypothetical protein